MAELCMITKKQKQLKYSSPDDWIKKMQYVQTTQYYLVIKRNEVLIHVTVWMILKNTMLGERNQLQRTTERVVLPILNV